MDARYSQKQGEAYGATPDQAREMLTYVEGALRECQAVEQFNNQG